MSMDEHNLSRGESLSAQALGALHEASGAGAALHLEGLNDAQAEAVRTLDGPVLLLAGAGTGKTKALTARVAHLLHTRRCRPNEILAVTFTNRAAREMRDRVRALVGDAVEGMPWLGTFHSLSAKVLRRHAELVGLQANFTILDTDDQLRLLKELIRAASIDEKRWPPRQLAGLIDHWKNRGLTPERVPPEDANTFAGGQGGDLYAQYQARLKTLNAADFGDLLLHCLTIFQNYPDVLQKYQRWFRYILVDEYQDTNIAQYLWLRHLSQADGAAANICCVGDDDQSIYGWRGAEVGNILRFEKDFPGAVVIRLEQNYRSTEHILAAASGVIAANLERLGKTLWTAKSGGDAVRLMGLWDGEDEARWIGEELEALQKGGRDRAPASLNDAAILVRAAHQMRAFEDRFLSIGLPYRVVGGPRFYERQEIRDAIAYFRVLAQPEDGLAFERIVNTPRRGVGEKALQTCAARARADTVSLVEGARRAAEAGAVRGAAGKAILALLQQFDHWRMLMTSKQVDMDHVDVAKQVLEDSGYTDMWRKDKSPDAPGRLENLKELINQIAQFDSLVGFLEHISLVMENDQSDDGAQVTIMTLHAAKGLEFPIVFLPGWEDGLFPSQRALDESGKRGLEEERRLAYVGMTRARERLYLSFAANRRVYGQWQSQTPSRFIDELPAAHVEVLTPPGLYGRGMAGSGWSGGARAEAGEIVASRLEAKARESSPYNSPGWRRLNQNAGRSGLRSPGEAKNLVIDIAAASAFGVGDRVFHEKFGYGAVSAVEGDKLTVDFDKSSPKRVVASYLKPADAV